MDSKDCCRCRKNAFSCSLILVSALCLIAMSSCSSSASLVPTSKPLPENSLLLSSDTRGIYSMDLETGIMTPIKENGTSGLTHKTIPRISLDRRTIAYSDDIYASRKYKGSQLFLMAADGSNQTRLEKLEADRTVWGYEDLKWMPDGKGLVVSDRGEGIYTLGTNGRRRSLRPRGGSARSFAISPDGKRIAYSGAGYVGVSDLETGLRANYESFVIRGVRCDFTNISIIWVNEAKVYFTAIERISTNNPVYTQMTRPYRSILWSINTKTGKMDIVTRAEPDHYWWNLTLSPSGDRLAVDQSIQADFKVSNKVPSTSIVTFDFDGKNRKETPIPAEYDVTKLSWSYR